MILIEIILTLLLAECSYRYVEVPIRVRGLAYFKPVKTQLKSLIAKSSITLVLVGLTLTILSGHFDYLQQAQHHHTKTTFKVSNHDHKNSLILPILKLMLIVNKPLIIKESIKIKCYLSVIPSWLISAKKYTKHIQMQ